MLGPNCYKFQKILLRILMSMSNFLLMLLRIC